MAVYLHALQTALPETAYPQSMIRDLIRAQPELDRLAQRLTTSIFNASGIDQRYSVVKDFLGTDDEGPGLFYDHTTGQMRTPSTGVRNDFYTVEATRLFVQAARQALAATPGLSAADVTHVVTVSCTGFFAPGPDYAIVRALGLAPHVQRFHVGFMGCYAAFPALKMARAFCEADPEAVVLVVCAELCTIHMHSARDPDTLIANSVFADGAAAALVTARPPAPGTPVLRMDHFETTLTPVGVGEADMAWTIGDQGYDMVLSTYVPAIIESHIQDALAPLLAHDPALAGGPYSAVDRWAIHPGGRSILDKVQTTLELSDLQLRPSREVLRQYGNMSSVTVLFILADLLASASDQERIGALAFGPGLTVESGLLTKLSGLD
ncbi:3-oxoacyl-[acyl-carrier-protein] synthase III C-terminal domain-containing protein [Deinococcus deserti]|uniref:Putative naringenin-chalcone synthase (Flavonone synthase) (6-deoxychalcone synthase) n=1 Tax=Deinococcus deserti (strain DSM 17065 / CIP 109153 / LMG 22923 / VCD115) TaxID=546414 RepID=C1CZF5_DEIDV|nr:3-oxoacyl-[acyl-carrier-protein] synthase III C-terminal domain-containing protein [Deinococcus deserti]ACO47203.1 putative naringenin-chalcone synthase (flavonone synthase) (6-deoxychalcone synthase) [Deinococcus deserti VCD115]